jgi:hypothetical protein
MDVSLEALLSVNLTLFQRLMVLYVFIGFGIVIAVQLSQTQTDTPLPWTRLTKDTKYVSSADSHAVSLFNAAVSGRHRAPSPSIPDTFMHTYISIIKASPHVFLRPLTNSNRPYWYSLYILEVLLLIVSAWPVLLQKMAGYVNGYEERILNTVWIGLLSLETLMVLGVVVQGIVKRFGPKIKQKTN